MPDTARQTVKRRGPGQAPRVDSVRNRHKIVVAAHRVFSALGPDVSVREVAKEAGVGLGTIYRHFPDKDALLTAVVEQRFRGLAAEIRSAIDTRTPWDAFAHMMRRMAEMMTEDRAFAGVAAAARMRPPAPADGSERPSTPLDQARDELDTVLLELAESAQAAGELRRDVGPMELGLVIGGVAMALGPGAPPAPPGPARRSRRSVEPPPWERYLNVALDGLRANSQGAAQD